jgi:hypothetical protein
MGNWIKSISSTGGSVVTQPHIGDVTAVTAAAPVPVVVDGQTVAKITITATAPITASFGSGDTLFAGVQVSLATPTQVYDQGWQRPAGITAGTPFSFDLTVPYPAASESWTIYLASRSEKFVNALVVSGVGITPNVVVAMAPLSLTAAPDVSLFRAGKDNGDGTFTANMYWDPLAKNMLIDWACLAPTDRSNWSGVQVWIKTPDGSGGFLYFAATGVQGIDAFQLNGTDYFIYATIAVEPTNIPVPPQSWDFIATSAANDANQTINRTAGHPTGPTVTLSTLAKSDLVTGFTATVTYENSEAGDQQFRLSGSWTNQTVPRYKGVRIMMRGFSASDIELADEYDGTSTFRTDAWPVPSTTKNVTIYAVPVFGDDTVGAIVPGTTPSVALTIQRQGGSAGTEYTSLVTGFACGAPYYGINGAGQQTLFIPVTWTRPATETFGGIVLKMIRNAVTYTLSGVEPNSPNLIEINNFPLPGAPETVNIYPLSVDTNNRSNTFVLGITAAATVVLPVPPGIGAPSTFNVTAAYVKLKVNGQIVLQLTPSFTAPATPNYGWMDFWARREDGIWYNLGSPDQGGPAGVATIEKLPAISFTWSFLLIAKDVNGKDSNGNAQSNPAAPPAGSLSTTLLIDPATTAAPLGNVTGFFVTASYTNPDNNGARQLLIVPFFTPPADNTWAYIQLWARREDTLWYQLGNPGTSGAVSVATIAQLPATTFTWTFMAISINANNQDLNGSYNSNPNSPPAGTPTYSLSIAPPGVGSVGVEYTSNVTFNLTFNGGVNPQTTSPTRADGTVQFQVFLKVIPPNDTTWGGYDLITMSEDPITGILDTTSAQIVRGTYKGTDGIYLTQIPKTVIKQALFAVSYDMNGRRNTLNAVEMSLGGTLTPRKELTFGSLTGMLDLGQALGSSFSSTEFALSGGKLIVNGLDFSKVISTTITTELGLAAGKLGVAQLPATKVTAGTFVGGVVYAGSVAASQVLAGTLVAGVTYTGTLNCSQLNAGTISVAITLTAPTIQVTSGTVTINLDAANKLKITDTSFNRFCSCSGAQWRIEDSSNSLNFSQLVGFAFQAQNGGGSSRVDLGPSSLQFNFTQVVGPRQTGPGSTTGTLSDLSARFNNLITALQNHGLIT